VGTHLGRLHFSLYLWQAALRLGNFLNLLLQLLEMTSQSARYSNYTVKHIKGNVKKIRSHRLLRCDMSPGKLLLELINLEALFSRLTGFLKAHARLLELGT
jgi:hypothetical protein